jgi:mono/diheme cytochrome c family protein
MRLLSLVVVVAALPSLPARAQAQPWRSGSGLVMHGGHLYVADADRGEISVFDASRPEAEPVRRIPTGDGPSQMVIGADGTLFATVRRADQVIAVRPDGAARAMSLPGEPHGLARDDAGRRLFVTLAAADEVVCLDAATLQILWSATVPPHPRPIAWLPGGYLVVGHLQEGALTVLGEDGEQKAPVPLRSGGDGSGRSLRPTQAWVLASAGSSLFAVYREVDTGAALSTSEYYGNAPMELRVATIERRGESLAVTATTPVGATFGLGTGPTAAALVPGAIALSAPGSNGLAFAPLGGDGAGARELHLTGGFSALAASSDGARVFGVSFSTRGVHAIEHGGTVSSQLVGRLGPSPLPAEVLAGRRLFHKANPAGVACASCHLEGLDDGLVWVRDGQLRQTPSLAGKLKDTAPYGWEGTQSTLDGYVRHTLQRLGHPALPDRQVAALVTYVQDYLPSPRPPARALDRALVKRGELIFQSAEAQCGTCHDPDSAFTDGATHDVGTVSEEERTQPRAEGQAVAAALETPALRGLARTAPYLHDGSAGTLEELLARTDGKMGRTSHLSEADRQALVAYLRSL